MDGAQEEDIDVQPDYDKQVQRNFRWNFTFNLLDGSSFWLGYSFLAPSVILPLYVSHYTHNTLVIGLIAMISASFYTAPQLFTANWVQHTPVKKSIMAFQGLLLERVPLFILPAVTWLLFDRPSIALMVFFFLFAWHTLGAGLTAVAWQEMLAKVIPQGRRGIFFGATNFLGNGTGVIGASVAAWLLDRYPFPYGYIICFSITAAFTLISYLFIIQTREIPVVTEEKQVSFLQYWSKLPAILKKDHNFSNFLLAQVVLNLSGMSWGFIAVYAQQHWSLGDGKVGEFNAALLIGQAVFNLIFGTLADRKGYKLVMELSALLAVLSIGLVFLAPQPAWFYVAFALRGASFAGLFLSMMFVMEFCTHEVRPTYIGLSSTVSGISSGLAPLLGGVLASLFGYPALFAITLVIGLAAFGLLRWLVRDPRHIKPVVIEEVVDVS
jgi:MFS family permease